MPRTFPIAALLLTLAWPARAQEAKCEDAKKSEHFAAFRATLPKLDALVKQRTKKDLTKELVDEPGETPKENPKLKAFLDAAPAKCAERENAWSGMEVLLTQGDGSMETPLHNLPLPEYYFLVKVEGARRKIPKCDDKSKKEERCRKAANTLLTAIAALKPSASWVPSMAIRVRDKVEACLYFKQSGDYADPVEVIPSVWYGGTYSTKRWKELTEDSLAKIEGDKVCKNQADATKELSQPVANKAGIDRQFGGAGITTQY